MRHFKTLLSVLLVVLVLVGCQTTPTGDNRTVITDTVKSGALTLSEGVVRQTGTRIDVTLTPGSDRANPVLFVGAPKEGTQLGYEGYCFAVERGRVTFCKMSDKLIVLADRQIAGVEKNRAIQLRMEIEDNVLRCFLLDDAEGITPWPETELFVESCEGFQIGCTDLKVADTAISNMTVTYYTPTVHVKTYTNPVYDALADPDVVYEDGTFYMYGTGGQGYGVHTSTDLVNWGKRGQVVYPFLWDITNNYWAPDLEFVDDKYYMAVTCGEQLGFATADSLMDIFTEVGEKPTYGKGTIDGHIFLDDDGKRYFYMVRYENGGNTIYGVELDENMNPVESTMTRLIYPSDPWEQTAGSVTEGPYMLKHNGLYYLTYSGSGYTGDYYAVGYAVSESPLGPFEKYEHNPILVGNSQIHGVGHHCVVTIPETQEMWMVYHCHFSLTEVQERKICIDRMRFSPVEGDIDRLEVYGPTVTPQPILDLGK